jgi:broad specificity phosphatase PhoE
MHLLLVRHGESEANREGRMQGRKDSPLSNRGREQARQLAGWLGQTGVAWDAAYCSPLRRAAETAEIVCSALGVAPPTEEPDLAEISAGSLEGMNRSEIAERHPEFVERAIMDLADFAAFGGEGYAEVQARVERLLERFAERHRAADERVLVVAHGGINFQLVKALVCRPVPRVCIVRMGNCSATQVRLRERRGTFMGELVWHVPIELMGEVGSADTGAIFR